MKRWALLVAAAAALNTPQTIRFDDQKAGEGPRGFSCILTGQGRPGVWIVVEDGTAPRHLGGSDGGGCEEQEQRGGHGHGGSPAGGRALRLSGSGTRERVGHSRTVAHQWREPGWTSGKGAISASKARPSCATIW